MVDPRGATKAPDATTLAVERTRLAYERTLMAWVRTAASLISFGFTLYKFFEYLHEGGAVVERGPRLLGARHFGTLMIAIGVVSLVIATAEHYRSMRTLREYARLPVSLAGIMAGLIGLLGAVGLVSVVWR